MTGAWARWLERCADGARTGSRTSTAVAALFLLVLVATGQTAPTSADSRPAVAAASVAQAGLPATGEIVLVAWDRVVVGADARQGRSPARRAAQLERGRLPRPRAPTSL